MPPLPGQTVAASLQGRRPLGGTVTSTTGATVTVPFSSDVPIQHSPERRYEKTYSRHGRRRIYRLASLRTADREGNDVLCVDNFFTGSRDNRRDLYSISRRSNCFATTLRSRSMSRSTRSTISPARPRRSITSAIRSRRRRPASWARSTCWGSPSGCAPASSRPRPARSTAIPTSIPRPRTTAAGSASSGPRACYDEGKRCAETLFFDYQRQHRAADPGRPHLQHLRPQHASGGRARRLELHHPGAAGRADHALRRRLADALLLLRRRSRRGPRPADGRRPRGRDRRSISATRSRSPSPSSPDGSSICAARARTVRISAAAAGRPDASAAPTSRRRRELLRWKPKVALDDGLRAHHRVFRGLPGARQRARARFAAACSLHDRFA